MAAEWAHRLWATEWGQRNGASEGSFRLPPFACPFGAARVAAGLPTPGFVERTFGCDLAALCPLCLLVAADCSTKVFPGPDPGPLRMPSTFNIVLREALFRLKCWLLSGPMSEAGLPGTRTETKPVLKHTSAGVSHARVDLLT